MYVFAGAELRVQGDGGRVAQIGLDEHDMGAAQGGGSLQRADQPGRDALAAVALGDGQVVEVDLAALSLELVEHVGCEAADGAIALERHDGDEVVAGEELLSVGVPRRCALVGIPVVEDLSEEGRQVAQQAGFAAAQGADLDLGFQNSPSLRGPPDRAGGAARKSSAPSLQ